jgi:glycosyltransferase involved in cell wall biosynthesis
VAAPSDAGGRDQAVRLCSPQLGVDPEANLGGTVYDRELLRAMANLGADVIVLLPQGEAVGAVKGWDIRRTERHRRSYYEYNWIFYRALWQEYRRQAFDVLRVHSPYSVGLGALRFASRARVPAVLHYLHVEPRRLWRAVDRMTLHRYAHVVTISEATRAELLHASNLEPARISVARPGVSDVYVPGNADPALEAAWGGAPVALYVGGLIARKNLLLAIRSVDRIRRAGIALRLVIAGTGDDRLQLEAEVARLGLGGVVEFRGRVTEQQKLTLMRSADLFVFPSTLEGFGMAAAEAMACGLPVVALRHGPATEFMEDGVSALLVDPAYADEQFPAAMMQLIAREDLRRTIQAGGRAAAAKLSWEHSARQVLDIYREVRDRAAR